MPRREPPAKDLSGLFHFRWSIPTLAAFAAGGNQAKFVALQNRLGASRGSLQRALAALIKAGLVRRNSGYGHPMRPEYLLTASGRTVAEASAALLERIEHLKIADVALKKWSLPVVHAVASAGGRFNRLQAELGGVTPRALAQALRDVQKAGLVERQLIDDSPPRAEYALTNEGHRLTDLAAALVKA